MAIKVCNGIFYQDFIAEICRQRSASTYLEIGVQSGINLSKIVVDRAIGIDPAFSLSVDPTQGKSSLELYRMSSDEFFKKHEISSIDVAFLDGMHLFEYLLRDIYNVEARSKRSGLIMLHDCLPFDGNMIARQDTGGAWTGDVWKIIPILKKYRPDMRVLLVDCMPTGVVCLTNLDPSSSVLEEKYLDIVNEFSEEANDTASLERLYDSYSILSAGLILSDFNQSRYLRV